MNRIAPYIVIALILAAIAAFFLGEHRGAANERTKWEAKIEKARADAATEARTVERRQQEKVNAALERKARRLAGINAGLINDLARLRKRASRMRYPARAHCKGTTGAELSGEDGRFLVGEAARADRIRAALGACYTSYDAMKK